MLLGCSVNIGGEQTDDNKIDAYHVSWWHLTKIPGSKSGSFSRPDYGIINIDNGELNLRHAILEGRDLGDYRLPYWPIRSFVSIFSHPIEIAHRCTLNVKSENKNDTILFRTGDYNFRLNAMSSKRVEEGFELSKFKNSDILKVTNRGSESPVLMEHFFIVDKGSRSIPIYIKATNLTDKTIENVEVEISYRQDFNWSSFGITEAQDFQQTEAPGNGSAKAFYAFSSGMGSGFEFQENNNCELSYRLNEDFNAWDVSIKNNPASLDPGESFVFSYNLAIIDEPLEQTSQTSFISENEFEQLEFSSMKPTETRTAPIDEDKRVTIHDVIENIEKPKVRGLGYIGGSTANDDLALMKEWGGNLAITRSNDPDIVAQGHELEMEMLLRGLGSYKTGEPISFDDFFINDINPEGYPDSYGQDEDHYYWYPVKPTLDFEKEFGKPMSEATLDEKVDYWNKCFVNKWRIQMENVREHDPDGNIWFYAPSPGMPYIDPFDYYDAFFGELSKLGEDLTVFPFYYGIDFDMPEYMMRRWKDAGIHRAVFLPGGPTYAKPSQFIYAITSARRGGADGTCGFSFSVTEDNFDDEWRWKSLLLAALANFPTPELDAYCFIEEPASLIEELAVSEVNVISGDSNADDLTEKLETYLPGRVKRIEALPENQPDGQMYMLIGDDENFEQNQWAFDVQDLEPGKGVIQKFENVVRISGSDKSGLQNATELILRFAEMGQAESKCNQLIEASGIESVSLKKF